MPINGTPGADLLNGTNGADIIFGFAGDDDLNGFGGNDELYGGDGDHDLLHGGTGNDIIDGGAGNRDEALYNDATSAVTVNLAITGPQAVGGGLGSDTLISIENVIGSAFNDTLIGDANNNSLAGVGGNDTLNGRGGLDFALYRFPLTASGVTVDLSITGPQSVGGGLGSDTLISIEGLYGSDFNDTLTGNTAKNILIGSGGNDTLNGGAGADTASYEYATSAVTVSLAITGAQAVGGGQGSDTLISMEGLTGSAFADRLTGDSRANVLTGNEGNDTLKVGGGADTLSGGAGADTLSGGGGADSLSGGAANDFLNGGAGNDTLTGGAGLDAFIFNTALGGSNIDTIDGFVVADDTIRIDNAIMAAAGAPGVLDAAAFFIGAAAGDASDRIIYDSATGALSYDSDGAGGAAQVQYATLSTGLALTNADFLVI